MLLEVSDLRVTYRTVRGRVEAVRGASFSVEEGEVLGIVGESGSGKSTLGLAVLRLLPHNAVVEGKVVYRGRDIYALDRKELRKLRGRELSAIFQDPYGSLNPTLTIGEQMIRIAKNLYPEKSVDECREMALEALKSVAIPDPERVLRSYPHELSGGMVQRVVIATAIMGKPKLLLADEPTSHLDVTIQAQILALLDDLRSRFNMSIILITHNLGVVAALCNNIAVMYAGKIVEYASTRDVLGKPLHPYTRGLLDCVPRITREKPRLHAIPGEPVNPKNMPPGCPFHPRCKHAKEQCIREEPPLVEAEPKHYVACWLYARR